MKVLLIAMMVVLLASCTTTSKKLNTGGIMPPKPAAINCPPTGLKKIAENVYQTDEKGYQNLKICLSDMVRYIEDTNALYVFFSKTPVKISK